MHGMFNCETKSLEGKEEGFNTFAFDCSIYAEVSLLQWQKRTDNEEWIYLGDPVACVNKSAQVKVSLIRKNHR